MGSREGSDSKFEVSFFAGNVVGEMRLRALRMTATKMKVECAVSIGAPRHAHARVARYGESKGVGAGEGIAPKIESESRAKAKTRAMEYRCPCHPNQCAIFIVLYFDPMPGAFSSRR
jgi:hypothetical protein